MQMETKIHEHGFAAQKKNGTKVTGAQLENLRNKQGGKCYYSGATLTLKNVSLDHRQPLSRGGEHCMENVVLCTRQINRMKGQMTEQEFLSVCLSIAKARGVASLGP